MKTATLLGVVALIVGTSGYLIKVPTVPTRPQLSPVGWVHLQKLVLPLFENVCEDSSNPIIVRLAQEFTLDSPTGVYLQPEVITNLKKLKTKGLLPKGEIFTDYDFDHLTELRAIYEVFFNAKDFDTFYKAAAWARQNVNCGLFVRAIYLAILNRRDTQKISVPAPYELIPNYFIKKDVIIKASTLMSGEEVVIPNGVRDEGNSYVLDANYTANFIGTEDESKLAYFHEDIGLNTFYFLQKLKWSPWFNTTPDMTVQYGEYLYHMMKQLAARYSLERYANGLPEVKSVNLDSLSATPYDPLLIYSNGNEFGHRTTPLDLANAENKEMLKTIESNIATVVAHLRDQGYDKTQILNHLMGILVTGERSFETLLQSSIAKDNTFTESQPAVLDHFLTSLRDPMFWRINQKIVDVVDDALKQLPVYTRNELYFPGVEVLNIDVKKIMTNFDYFHFDVTDALKTDTTNIAFQVKIEQSRLNHKPFVVKLNISSLVSKQGLIKIYLGPKVAPGELTLNKNRFFLLDVFPYNFKVGSNIVSRSSDEMQNLSPDFTLLRTLRKNVEDAEFGLDALPLKDIESLLWFPQRLVLPKGTPEGLPLQIFVFVAPFVKSTFSGLNSISNSEFNSAILSPGYPLDLEVYDNQWFNLPNAMVKDVSVTHKGEKASNYGGAGVTNKWSKGNFDPETRPDYSAQDKEPFDYTARKSQYGQKEQVYAKNNYAVKRGFYTAKGTTDKNYIVTDQSELVADNSVGKIDLVKDSFNNQFKQDTIDVKPIVLRSLNTQYAKKSVGYEKKDYAAKRKYYSEKNITNKNDIVDVHPDDIDEKLVGKIHLQKDIFDEEIKDFSESDQVSKSDKTLDKEDRNTFHSLLTNTFTRKPSVYNYITTSSDIIRPEDYIYDEYNSQVYE